MSARRIRRRAILARRRWRYVDPKAMGLVQFIEISAILQLRGYVVKVAGLRMPVVRRPA